LKSNDKSDSKCNIPLNVPITATNLKQLTTKLIIKPPIKAVSTSTISSKLLKDRFPDVYKQIHPTLNCNVDIDKLTYGSRIEIYWLCDVHMTCNQHIWKVRVGRRTGNGRQKLSQCPYCTHHHGLICACDSFGVKLPQLLQEFNLAKNYGNQYNQNIDPSKLSCGSQTICHWKCSNPNVKCDHHIWQTSVTNRCGVNASGGSKCPFCVHGKCCPCNSFPTLYPHLVHEFELAMQTDIGKSNCNIDLSIVTCSSDRVCWWKCVDHETCDAHIWQAPVYSRTRGCKCPFCNGGASGICCQCKSLAIACPELMEEFMFEKNNHIDPYKISYGSSKKCWWQCSTCDHEWCTIIDFRTNRRTGCPKCQSSHLELETAYVLKSLGIDFIIQKVYSDCTDKRHLKFDFYLPKYNILIEVDGQQHFEIVTFAGVNDPGRDINDRHRKDRIKNMYTETNTIHLLRISYSEIKNILNHITTFVNTVKSDDLRQQKFEGKEYLTSYYKEKVLY
jgi:very-short-patch-repair endonuclease